MNNNSIISRLEITGLIDESTPLIVIEEILDAHGIPYDGNLLYDTNYVNKIFERSRNFKSIIYTPHTKKCLPVIATYVNNKMNWDLVKLIEAFDYLQSFTKTTEVPLSFSIGRQTPENTFSLNACVLYRLCKVKGLLTLRRTTLEQMGQSLKMLSESSTELLIRVNSMALNNTQLINMITASNIILAQEYPKDRVSLDSIKSALDELSGPVGSSASGGLYNTNRIMPRTQSESVVLAALNYKLDFSRFENPYKEYQRLKISRESFIPFDSSLRSVYERNKYIFDLNYTFVPELPMELYDESVLKSLCRMEGLLDHNMPKEFCYEALQVCYFSKTWYQGVWPNMESETPIECLEVECLHSDEIICYGIRDFDPGKGPTLFGYTYQELVELLKHNRNFNSASGETFDNIRKLKVYCLNEIGPKEPKAELFQLISSIELELSQVGTKLSQLKQYSATLLPVLTDMLHLGMIMRGWSGPVVSESGDLVDPQPDYPVKSAPLVDQNVIDLAFDVQMERIELAIESLDPEQKHVLYDLPLVLYKEGEYKVSNDRNERLTFFQRIELVKEGEKTTSMLSCVRLSSNWIVSSAYCYLQSIGHTPGFDIADLEHIA